MSPILIGCGIVTVIGPSGDLRVVRAEEDGGGQQDREAGQREDQVGEAHQQVVGVAAEVAGQRADRRSDHGREKRDEDRDPERRPDAVDDPAQVVAAELIGAEDVPALERRRRASRSSLMFSRSSSSKPYGAIWCAKIATSAMRIRTTRLTTASLWRKKRIRAYAHWLRALTSTPDSYARSWSRGASGASASRARRRPRRASGRLHHPVPRARELSHSAPADRGSRTRCPRSG